MYVKSDYENRTRISQVELETQYRHRILSSNDQMAELEISIEAIDLYYEGKHLGSIDYVPENLGTVHATVYANGEIRFDREVFIVGDPYEGFEMISTRYYDGYVLDEFRRGDGYRAGRLDLQSGSIYRINSSRLFDPYAASGYIPISLLPENEGWLWDYGSEAMSAGLDNYDYYYGTAGVGMASGSALLSEPRLSSDEYQFHTRAGADVLVRRDTEIQRIE